MVAEIISVIFFGYSLHPDARLLAALLKKLAQSN